MRTFYVVGIYEDESERFADSYCVHNAAQAESLAKSEHPGLQVAGVFHIWSNDQSAEPVFDR